MLPPQGSSIQYIAALRHVCFTMRIPLNVADHPRFSDFSFPITHRWPSTQLNNNVDESPSVSPLQIAISSSASSCRLAVRLKREIVSKVSRHAGDACESIAKLRQYAQNIAKDNAVYQTAFETDEDLLSSGSGRSALNKPITQLESILHQKSSCSTSSYTQGLEPSTTDFALATRMRWISQISEYWPLDQIAALGQDEKHINRLLTLSLHFTENADSAHLKSSDTDKSPPEAKGNHVPPKLDVAVALDATTSSMATSSYHHFNVPRPTLWLKGHGRILLVGSGPGHPGLLTVAAHAALTKQATLVLSDKLVPSEVLALIPKTTHLYIAKKYPGNAEGAQNELMQMALDGARKGEVVVRLKQGDPYVYGRGGEEVLFFRQHGFECCVIPGVSSALAAPTMAGIPVTQRGTAESFIVCTGVGRKGKAVTVPGYQRNQTLIVLMGVARLHNVVETLVCRETSERRSGAAYPINLPIAIIERASSPDQRLVATTLENICNALDHAGEQRPPGMMVIGWSVLALEGTGDVTVLDDVQEMNQRDVDEADKSRVARWLNNRTFIVREGLSDNWDDLGPTRL